MEVEVGNLLGVDGKGAEALKGRSEGPKSVIKNALQDNSVGARRTTAVSRAWKRSAKWLGELGRLKDPGEKENALNELIKYNHPAHQQSPPRENRKMGSLPSKLGDLFLTTLGCSTRSGLSAFANVLRIMLTCRSEMLSGRQFTNGRSGSTMGRRRGSGGNISSLKEPTVGHLRNQAREMLSG